jgi:Mn2+/Fe2+ NRAMP family transporter
VGVVRDPPGITVYSVLGTDYGFQLLWVLLVSTVALIAFHSLVARMGVVTGQGLMGLIRDRYGPRYGGAAMVLLLVANLSKTCAELAASRPASSCSGSPAT